MTANLILIALTAVVGLVGFAGLLFKSWQDQKTGAALEAGKVDAASVKTETAIAAAAVAAPTTRAAVVDQLKAGTF